MRFLHKRGGVSITSPPSRKKKPREPYCCATIESIVRQQQAEPTGEDVRLAHQTAPGAVGSYTILAKPDTLPPILGYRECKCNIKKEGISPRLMTEKVHVRDNAKCSFCNYDASYFETGFFWCKYHYWIGSAVPTAASLRYLDVIG